MTQTRLPGFRQAPFLADVSNDLVVRVALWNPPHINPRLTATIVQHTNGYQSGSDST